MTSIESGYVAYDPSANKLHELNALGALLAELCDGSRSTADIWELVAPLLPSDVTGEIERWINQSMTAGLLVDSTDTLINYREFTLDELSELVHRIRRNGEALGTAYLCQKKITTLTPHDADAWYLFGDLALRIGQRDVARTAYEQYIAFHPEDAEVQHVLAALRDDTPPPRASDACVLQTFRTFAAIYDNRMLEQLEYQAPRRLDELLTAALNETTDLKILDLGCGTGLSGTVLKARAAKLVGIDLSPEMLDVARARGIYDLLENAEITTWLEHAQSKFDVIASCDCLIYFGDLRRIVSAAAKQLEQNGWLVFTLERGEQYPFKLTDTGRYAHHFDHVREIAAAAGLTVYRLQEGFLRFERGEAVTGLLAALTRRSGELSV